MIRLLDTDTFILLLRGTALVHPRTAREKDVSASARRIRERCRKETSEGRRVGLSAVSLSELEFGLRSGGRYEEKLPALQQVLLPFERFAFDPVDCVHHYGHIRAALEKTGKLHRRCCVRVFRKSLHRTGEQELCHLAARRATRHF